MKAIRVSASDVALLDPGSEVWAGAKHESFDMYPTPLAMVEEVSPFLARSSGHGIIQRLDVSAAHNGRVLAIWVSWKSDRHAEINDLNQFVDGVAVMFSLARGANAVTMGAKGQPVNAWFWRANCATPYCVIAEGFASVRRLATDQAGDLVATARHQDGKWTVVFRRALVGPDGHVKLVVGQSSKLAFAVWNGGNAERSGRKSFSGEFVNFDLAK